MKQLKKTILTLVALLAVTTGAWADDYFYLVVDGTTATLKYGDKGENPYFKDGFVPLWKTSTDDNLDIKGFTTITVDASCQNLTNLTSLPPVFQNFTALTVINNLENINTTSITRMAGLFYGCSSLQTLDLSDWNTASVTNMMNMFKGCLSLETIYVGEGWSTEKVTTSLYMFTGCTKLPNFDASIVDKTNAYAGGYLKAKPGTVLPTPNVNEWSLTMPAGNVEVSVDYFAQAEFAMSTGTTPVALAPAAIADVPANTDDPIVTAGTVANIGTSEVKQGTLMYFVSQSTGNTVPEAPDYDTEGWSENVPTANGLAEGNAYVWYYIKGAEPANIADRTDANTCSDSPITALGTTGIVTIAAEPTYDVTLNAEGLSDEEAANWKAATGDNDPAAFPLEGVKKGQTVTVTYTGNRHVKGVKAEKKAAKPVTLATALENGATIKVNFKWRNKVMGDYVQGVYNAASGTFTVSKGGEKWGIDARAVCKVEKSGDNIIIGAGLSGYDIEGMVWTFNTTNDTYTTTNGADVKQFPTQYGLISVSVNDTDITSTLSELK